MRIAALALTLALAAAPAWATTRPGWFALDPARGFGAGSGVCSAPDPVTGFGTCLVLRCMPGEPLEWAVVAVARDLGPGPVAATVQVDRRAPHPLTLAPTGRTGVREAAAPVDAPRDAGLIADLRAGRRAVLTLPGGTAAFALAGSSRAIAAAEAACTAAAFAPVPPAVLPPLPPSAEPAGALNAAAVRAWLVGARLVKVTPAGEETRRFGIDGRYEAQAGTLRMDGFWSLGPTGTLCWRSLGGATGCHRYFEDAGGILRVRNEDGGRGTVLGPVVVLPR